MTPGRIRLAGTFVLAMVTLSLPSNASAKIPAPSLCEVGPMIVGSPCGPSLACPGIDCGTATDGYRVVVRNLSNAPEPYVTVQLDFSAEDVVLMAQQDPGFTLDCSARILEGMTGPDGVVIFHPRFSGSDYVPRVHVLAEGILLGYASALSTDVDLQVGSTGVGDLARFAQPILSLAREPALDLVPCSGNAGEIGLPEFALVARACLGGGQATPCP